MGAVSGLIGASGISRLGATVMNGALSGTSSVVGDLVNGEDINWARAALSGIIGVGAGYIGGAGVNNTRGLAAKLYPKIASNLDNAVLGMVGSLNKAPNIQLSLVKYNIFIGSMKSYIGGTVLNILLGGLM